MLNVETTFKNDISWINFVQISITTPLNRSANMHHFFFHTLQISNARYYKSNITYISIFQCDIEYCYNYFTSTYIVVIFLWFFSRWLGPKKIRFPFIWFPSPWFPCTFTGKVDPKILVFQNIFSLFFWSLESLDVFQDISFLWWNILSKVVKSYVW